MLKPMNCALKLMDIVLKLVNVVLKLMNFVFKLMQVGRASSRWFRRRVKSDGSILRKDLRPGLMAHFCCACIVGGRCSNVWRPFHPCFVDSIMCILRRIAVEGTIY